MRSVDPTVKQRVFADSLIATDGLNSVNAIGSDELVKGRNVNLKNSRGFALAERLNLAFAFWAAYVEAMAR